MTDRVPNIPSPEVEGQVNPRVGDVVVVRKQINDTDVREDFDGVVTWREGDGLAVAAIGTTADGSETMSGFPGSCTVGEVVTFKEHWSNERVVAAYSTFLDNAGLNDNRNETIRLFRDYIQGNSEAQ
ncbi:MAG: hypothetical protein JWM81_546 [Candidatus Saccharibacteria bacterium]|nr:hypothetical protein [Candidatus Saccharibacteria bacterium]